jgi:hypothetical protein
MSDVIQVTFVGLTWDGTVAGADRLCDSIRSWHPWWMIYRRTDGALDLTVNLGYRTGGESFRMTEHDTLLCRPSATGQDPFPVDVQKGH